MGGGWSHAIYKASQFVSEFFSFVWCGANVQRQGAPTDAEAPFATNDNDGNGTRPPINATNAASTGANVTVSVRVGGRRSKSGKKTTRGRAADSATDEDRTQSPARSPRPMGTAGTRIPGTEVLADHHERVGGRTPPELCAPVVIDEGPGGSGVQSRDHNGGNCTNR